MKKIIFLLFAVCYCIVLSAQSNDSILLATIDSTTLDSIVSSGHWINGEPIEYRIPEEDREEIHNVFEVAPAYKDGELALMKYIAESIKYPDYEKEAEIQGQVLLRFVIEKDGTVSSVEPLRKISPGLTFEAKRIIKSTSGKWTAGQIAGQAVRGYWTIPITFTLSK